MTVTAQATIYEYTGNGSATLFAFGCRVLDEDDLVVEVDGSALALGVHYTVSGVGEPSGGSVLFVTPPGSGDLVRIFRQTRATRETDYQVAGSFPAEVVNRDFDRAIMAIQDMQSGAVELGNTLRVPAGEVVSTFPDRATRASKLAGFDSNGDPVALFEPTPSGATALQLALASIVSALEGAGMVGFNPSLSYPRGTTVGGKLLQHVNVLDKIPAYLHDSIFDYTLTADVIDGINEAFAVADAVHFSAGLYFGTRPINMSARGEASANWGKRLIGDGAATTRLHIYPGDYACLDMTGMASGSVEQVAIISDNAGAWGLIDAARGSIGIKHGRGAASTQGADVAFIGVHLFCGSIMARNGGNGSVGFGNHSSEHVYRLNCQVYANLPLADHTSMQFSIPSSSDHPTHGAEYESPFLSVNSCTNHVNLGCAFIAYDSFRIWWGHQVGQIEFINCYTSTRFQLDTTPANAESFYLTGGAANVTGKFYQEGSGLFGATYRQDHKYVSMPSAGAYSNIKLLVARGALDMGFALPGAASKSILIGNGAALLNCEFNCNYLPNMYDASGDNCGFAADPFEVVGTPHSVRNVKFVVDQSADHGADAGLASIGPYCANVQIENFLTGKTRRYDAGNVFTPSVVGFTTPGAATYTFRSGKFERHGGLCFFTIGLAWSAHTGTGALIITGLPFVADADQSQSVAIYASNLTIGAGYQLIGWIPNNQSIIYVARMLVAGGPIDGVAMDTSCDELTITGVYRIKNAN